MANDSPAPSPPDAGRMSEKEFERLSRKVFGRACAGFDLDNYVTEARRAREEEERKDREIESLRGLLTEFVGLWHTDNEPCDVGPDCLLCRAKAALSGGGRG